MLHGDLAFAGVVGPINFSPDGRYLVTALQNDPTVRLWLWRPGDLIFEASSRLSRNLTMQEWRQYFGDQPYYKTCPNLPVHYSVVEAGRRLAEEGDIDGARAILSEICKLDPSLALDPDREMRMAAARGLMAEGDQLARNRDIPAAAAAKFRQALERDPELQIDSERRAREGAGRCGPSFRLGRRAAGEKAGCHRRSIHFLEGTGAEPFLEL